MNHASRSFVLFLERKYSVRQLLDGVAPGKPGERWKPPVIRELIDAAFSDEDLLTFCFDNYQDVYNKFAGKQTRTDRILMFVEYVVRQNLQNELLEKVKIINPRKYDEFRFRLSQT